MHISDTLNVGVRQENIQIPFKGEILQLNTHFIASLMYINGSKLCLVGIELPAARDKFVSL